MPRPTFSIIIINWNGLAVLPRCLAALHSQTRRDFEIILVDNGSTDGSAEFVRGSHPEVHLISLGENTGFAPANNLAARHARAAWLIFLNNDAFPSSGWLDALTRAIQQHPHTAMFASRLLMADQPGWVDGTGDACHVSGAVWNRQHRHPAAAADAAVREVFAPQGAAALIRRDAFESVGGFDEDFFAYHEDIDLAFRLRLRGHHCLYLPDALVHHKGSHTTGRGSDFAVEHGHRNRIWCWWQDMPAPLLWLYLPQHLLANLFFILYIGAKGQFPAILKSQWRALLGMPRALRKRRQIQRARTASSRAILAALERGLLTPYVQGIAARRMARRGSAPPA
jgi:GT2 family glycosyltransferase